MKSTNILIIDDHSIFRLGLSTALSTSMPESKLYEADSINSAMQYTECDMNLILLDIHLPGLNGLEGIALLKRKFIKARIAIISSHDDFETMRQANLRGAVGFISKVAPLENSLAEIRFILHGLYLGSVAATKKADFRNLTPRQCEVLNLLDQGQPNKVIAHQLSVSESAVSLHVRNILEFFKAKSRTEAVFIARRQGLLS